jgi:hypothetical protein
VPTAQIAEYATSKKQIHIYKAKLALSALRIKHRGFLKNGYSMESSWLFGHKKDELRGNLGKSDFNSILPPPNSINQVVHEFLISCSCAVVIPLPRIYSWGAQERLGL